MHVAGRWRSHNLAVMARYLNVQRQRDRRREAESSHLDESERSSVNDDAIKHKAHKGSDPKRMTAILHSHRPQRTGPTRQAESTPRISFFWILASQVYIQFRRDSWAQNSEVADWRFSTPDRPDRISHAVTLTAVGTREQRHTGLCFSYQDIVLALSATAPESNAPSDSGGACIPELIDCSLINALGSAGWSGTGGGPAAALLYG